MELSQAVANEQYVGGQLAFQIGDRSYRGEIASVDLSGDQLTVHFVWLAEMGDTDWEATDPRPYSVDLRAYNVLDKGNKRFTISSAARDELVILCPPDDSTELDLSKVHGLLLLMV
jgi:hypothetical protein